jgi:hypothetical protein
MTVLHDRSTVCKPLQRTVVHMKSIVDHQFAGNAPTDSLPAATAYPVLLPEPPGNLSPAPEVHLFTIVYSLILAIKLRFV